MGLTAGLVPPRVDAPVKQGLFDLVGYAREHGGWSAPRSAGVLGVEHTRLVGWATDRLPDPLAGCDNVPQMKSKATVVFTAGARIAQHFGRPSTRNDQVSV